MGVTSEDTPHRFGALNFLPKMSAAIPSARRFQREPVAPAHNPTSAPFTTRRSRLPKRARRRFDGLPEMGGFRSCHRGTSMAMKGGRRALRCRKCADVG